MTASELAGWLWQLMLHAAVAGLVLSAWQRRLRLQSGRSRRWLLALLLLLPPITALVFLVAAVGIPLGGIVFLEGAFDHEYRKLEREVEALREEVRRMRDAGPSEPGSS